MCPHVFTTVIRDDGLLPPAQNIGARNPRRALDANRRAMPYDTMRGGTLIAQFDDVNPAGGAGRCVAIGA